MFEHHSDTHANLHLSPVVYLKKLKIGSMGTEMQYTVVLIKVIIGLIGFA
jgi:hypothetical protein